MSPTGWKHPNHYRVDVTGRTCAACGELCEKRQRMCDSCRWLRRSVLGRTTLPPSIGQRLMTKLSTTDPTQCWEWTGALNPYGYGQLGTLRAHRAVYEYLKAPIPKGLHLDHLCRNRKCVKTWRENVCRRGHTMEDALVIKSGPQAGRRNCRTCAEARYAVRAADPAWRARRAAQEKRNRLRRQGRAS